jgi:DNA-binding Xre family transcriptional regulator
MITLEINQIMAARGIERPHNFLVKSGFTRHVASSILDGTIRNIKLDLIEKLCLILYCTPYDLLWWKPDKNTIVVDHHPILVLKKQRKNYNWKESLKTMPLDEIDLLTTKLNKNDRGSKTGDLQ